jgi:protein TonB
VPGGTGSGSGTGNAPGFSTAPPPPPPTPPACPRPQVPARTVNAVAPDTPDIARQQGVTGNVEVKVDLNEKSQVTSVSIYKTANHLLDKAALDAARGSRFQTAIENCQPIASSYRFVVEFQAE